MQRSFAKPDRKGPRSKSEIQKERREKLENAGREIDQIHDDYLAKLSRNSEQATAAVYCRYSTRFQHSIGDQVRAILEHALLLDIYVPRELIFFDLAVRGFKKQRVGLSQVETALAKKKASALLLFSSSRLFRKTFRTLEFVERVHRGLGIRCIFVKSGVDTNDKQQWESLLAVQAMMDQFVVQMYNSNIHASHVGLLSKQLVFGTLSYGYTGIPIPGEFTKQKKPRCRIAIDEQTAEIVQRIFRWFVDDQLSISEIVCRLNGDADIPLTPRATSGMWTRLAVRNLLESSRYCGVWRYGVTESVYIADGDYVRQKRRIEPLSEVVLEELRIVSDTVWLAAQARRLDRAGKGGRPPEDGDYVSRPRLLNGLVVCPEHEDQQLYVSGTNGHSMHCPICARLPADERSIYSKLNRVLATELICKRLADLVNADTELPLEVLKACEREAHAVHQPDPKRLTQLQLRVKQLARSIAFTRDSVGETPEDEAEAKRAIVAYQHERAQALAEIENLLTAKETVPRTPTEAEVREMLLDLGKILSSAANADDVTEVSRAKEVIRLLTGGVIKLYQMGEKKPRRGWLQARFELSLLPYLVRIATGRACAEMPEPIEVVVDIRPPAIYDAEVNIAWGLYKQGRLGKEIAIEIGCGRSKVTRLLKDAAVKFGEPYVDGRQRRATLQHKQVDPPLYQRMADPVMVLVSENMFLEDIAEQLGVAPNTITHAIRFWHESRGLPVPDGRTRYAQLAKQSRSCDDNGEQKIA